MRIVRIAIEMPKIGYDMESGTVGGWPKKVGDKVSRGEASARSRRRSRRFNAIWNGETLELVEAINIGVAIAVEDGLIAPAILDCAALDEETIGVRLCDLVARSRAGCLRALEITGPMVTLSLGMFLVSAYTATVTPPQVAILTAAKTEPRPVVRDGQIVVRQVMTATLSADYRAVDGAAGARFLGDLEARLQPPGALAGAAPLVAQLSATQPVATGVRP